MDRLTLEVLAAQQPEAGLYVPQKHDMPRHCCAKHLQATLSRIGGLRLEQWEVACSIGECFVCRNRTELSKLDLRP